MRLPTARSRSNCWAERPAGFRVLTGEDAQYHEALSDGADGAILLSAHLETEAFASVTHGLQQGDRDARVACWKTLRDLTRLLFAEPSPSPAKYWLARDGLIERAEVRLPMVEVSAELAARLDAEIERRRPPLLRRAYAHRSSPSLHGEREDDLLAQQQPIGHDRREAEQHRPDRK